jgi:hypothetical protein
MAKQFSFCLDDSCVEWYDYHFHDTILRNDIVWRTWRDVLQKYLTTDQLHGQRCALCGAQIKPGMLTLSEYVGGFKIITCARRCETSLERDMRQTLKEVEALAMEHASKAAK